MIFFCYLHYAFFLVISEIHVLFGLKMNEDDVCLVDCATTHTILRDKIYFPRIDINKSYIQNLVEGSGRANITLPNGTRFHINDALYSSKSRRNLLCFKDIRRNLLCFKDIRRNGYHIETIDYYSKSAI